MKRICLSMLVVVALSVSGCMTEDADQYGHVASATSKPKKPSGKLTQTLQVQITFGNKSLFYSGWDKQKTQLCFDRQGTGTSATYSNCWDLTYVASTSVGNTYSWTLVDGPSSSPFVNHADDWDQFWLVKPSGKIEILKEIKITAEVGVKSFDFADWQTQWGHWLGKGYSFEFASHVALQRKRALYQTMGYNKIADGPAWNTLPSILRSITEDIGQSGLTKYSPAVLDQGGCDETYCWHYVETHQTDAENVLDVNCNGGPNNYCFDTTTTPHVCEENIFPHHGWKQNNRLARISFLPLMHPFTMQITGYIPLAERVNPNVGGATYDNWITTGTAYTPKAGDMLFRRDRCGAISHVMMLVSSFSGSDPSLRVIKDSTGDWEIWARIVEGADMVVARDRFVADLDATCDDGTPRFTYWIGIAP